MIELNEVECDECHHHFIVKDVFQIKYNSDGFWSKLHQSLEAILIVCQF